MRNFGSLGSASRPSTHMPRLKRENPGPMEGIILLGPDRMAKLPGLIARAERGEPLFPKGENEKP